MFYKVLTNKSFSSFIMRKVTQDEQNTNELNNLRNYT